MGAKSKKGSAPVESMSIEQCRTELDKLNAQTKGSWTKSTWIRFSALQSRLLEPQFDESDNGIGGENAIDGSDNAMNGAGMEDAIVLDKNTKNTAAEIGATEKAHNSWEMVKLMPPKSTFDGTGPYEEFYRSISIWRSLYVADETSITDNQNRLLGIALMESIRGAAQLTIHARTLAGHETYTSVMSTLRAAYGKNAMPHALAAYRTFESFKRSGGVKLRDFLNEFMSLRAKALAAGNDEGVRTAGLVLLEKAQISAQLHAQILTTCQQTPGGLVENKFPAYDTVLSLLTTYADSYESADSRGGKGGKGKGKGNSALFTSGKGGAFDEVGGFFYALEGESSRKKAGQGKRDKGQKGGKGDKGKGGWKDKGKGKGKEKGGKGKEKGGKGKGKGKGNAKGNAQKGVCWAFQNGSCPWGKECKFEHPGESNRKRQRQDSSRFEELDDDEDDAAPVVKRPKVKQQ